MEQLTAQTPNTAMRHRHGGPSTFHDFSYAADRWERYAAEENWEAALVGFLEDRWWDKLPLWHTVNAVVAESGQAGRADVRRATKETLAALMDLIKQGRVVRFKRCWVASRFDRE